MNDKIMFFEDFTHEIALKENIVPREPYESYLRRHVEIHMGKGIPLPPIDEGDLSPVSTLVDGGRWMWECRACGSGMLIPRPRGNDDQIFSLCPSCMYQGWVDVILPHDWRDIEDELLKQPGYRTNTAFRNWQPEWSLDLLRERTASAQKQIESGIEVPRRASFGTTRLWSVGEVVTANKKNTHERQPIRDIMGRNGPAGPWENAIHFWNATSSQRDGITDDSGMMLFNTSTGTFEGRGGSAWSPFLRWQLLSQSFQPSLSVVRGTYSHSLGCKPMFTQLVVRNDTASPIHGIPPNEFVVIGEHGGSGRMVWSMYNQTLTTVDIAMWRESYNSGDYDLIFFSPTSGEPVNETVIGANAQGHTAWVSSLSFGILIAG